MFFGKKRDALKRKIWIRRVSACLKYTIQEKITAVNQELSEPTDGLPAVSLSVGVAFSDRENPGESIFKDADKALYQIKEHGKHGCGFYGEKETEE